MYSMCQSKCKEKPTCICCDNLEIEYHCSCELCGGGWTIFCKLSGNIIDEDDPACDDFKCSECGI